MNEMNKRILDSLLLLNYCLSWLWKKKKFSMSIKMWFGCLVGWLVGCLVDQTHTRIHKQALLL